MLACFSPPVCFVDKCAFVCTLNYYISIFRGCQAIFAKILLCIKDKTIPDKTQPQYQTTRNSSISLIERVVF